ncbi:hypothetical protein ACWOBE_01740 [Hutsoniella sourekii]
MEYFLFISILSMVPLVRIFNEIGEVIWLALMLATFYAAYLVEKKKKQYGIHNYKEIIAFSEAMKLDEMDKMKEEAKRPYQKVLFGILAGLTILIVSGLLDLLF